MSSMIWNPDSCKCSLEFSGANTKKNFVKFIKKCKLHDKFILICDDCVKKELKKN